MVVKLSHPTSVFCKNPSGKQSKQTRMTSWQSQWNPVSDRYLRGPVVGNKCPNESCRGTMNASPVLPIVAICSCCGYPVIIKKAKMEL
eukprot:g43773.t1